MKMRKRMSWLIIVAIAAALAVVGFIVAPVFGLLTHQAAKPVCAAAAALKARCLLPR